MNENITPRCQDISVPFYKEPILSLVVPKQSIQCKVFHKTARRSIIIKIDRMTFSEPFLLVYKSAHKYFTVGWNCWSEVKFAKKLLVFSVRIELTNPIRKAQDYSILDIEIWEISSYAEFTVILKKTENKSSISMPIYLIYFYLLIIHFKIYIQSQCRLRSSTRLWHCVCF